MVAQFYATLWLEPDNEDIQASRLHWTLEGQRFHVTYADFAQILGFGDADRERVQIDICDPQADTYWGFMYEERYADPRHGISHGIYHGMIPYFRVLNNLIRQTLTPKIGDHSSILSATKTVMFAMRPRATPF